MDFFLLQNVKADVYYKQLNTCRADNAGLLVVIKEKDYKISQKDIIIAADTTKYNMCGVQLSNEQQKAETLTKQNNRLKMGLVATSVFALVAIIDKAFGR